MIVCPISKAASDWWPWRKDAIRRSHGARLNTALAIKSSHGTSVEKVGLGVSSNNTPPMIEPIRLAEITTMRNFRPANSSVSR